MAADATALFGLESPAARVGAGVLLMQAGTYAMDAFGAVNSSPWTAENFGGDADKARSCREYVYHAVGMTMVYCTGAAILTQSPWPLIGAVLQLVYMYWIYMRALRRATQRGSTGFSG